MLTLILSVPPHLFETCSVYSFLPPCVHIYYQRPILQLLPLLIFIFTLSSPTPPQLGWARIDHPPGRRPRLPASIACLRFRPMPGEPRSSLHQPVTGFPLPVDPHFPSRTCTQVPVSQRGSPVRGLLLFKSTVV